MTLLDKTKKELQIQFTEIRNKQLKAAREAYNETVENIEKSYQANIRWLGLDEK